MGNISKKYTRTVKCPVCENSFDRNVEDFEHHNGRWYHKHCFDSYITEVQHRKELIEYICYLFKISAPKGLILKQIKEFQDELGYTLKGMELTLRYFHEIQGNEVDAKGIGIIPYVYDEARRYYSYIQKVKSSFQNDFNNILSPKPKVVKTKFIKKITPTFNIEEL